MKPLADDFQWVIARSKCSLAVVFKELEDGVHEDVKMLKKLYPQDPAIYDVAGGGGNRFSVTLVPDAMTPMIKRWVRFELREDWTIYVASSDKTLEMIAVLTLNNDGQCRLKVKDQELEQWQFRRMALESLFFGPQ